MKNVLLGVVLTVALAVLCGASFQKAEYSYSYKWIGSSGASRIKDMERDEKIAAMTNAGWRLVDIEMRGDDGEYLYGLFEKVQ